MDVRVRRSVQYCSRVGLCMSVRQGRSTALSRPIGESCHDYSSKRQRSAAPSPASVCWFSAVSAKRLPDRPYPSPRLRVGRRRRTHSLPVDRAVNHGRDDPRRHRNPRAKSRHSSQSLRVGHRHQTPSVVDFDFRSLAHLNRASTHRGSDRHRRVFRQSSSARISVARCSSRRRI